MNCVRLPSVSKVAAPISSSATAIPKCSSRAVIRLTTAIESSSGTAPSSGAAGSICRTRLLICNAPPTTSFTSSINIQLPWAAKQSRSAISAASVPAAICMRISAVSNVRPPRHRRARAIFPLARPDAGPIQCRKMRSYPRLPVLGWSAFSGPRATPSGGVLNNPFKRYTTSGRAAIALALRALDIERGDKVLVPTYHCPTMIAPVARIGAQPVFYPITASGAADQGWLERAQLGGVRALLATHYFGIPQPMSRLRAFCDAHRIALIEDCAHAFFGEYEGAPVGGSGNLAIASLPKFFPTPE